ncbi:MAG: DUF4235 domain-containing protein [Calditrichia bacterium]
MGLISEKKMWQLVGAGSALLAGMAVKKVLGAGWQKVMDEEPPKNPASRSTSWGDAVLWTAATGVVIGVAKMLARRGAVTGWEKATGEAPPDL